jgi:hypothetical protein
MRIIIPSVISILCGALFFFAIPGGNPLKLDLQGVLFGLFFGVVTALPFFLFCTLPIAFFMETFREKMRLKFRYHLLLYVVLSVIFLLIYRFTIFYWAKFEGLNTFAVFGYGITCSIAFCLSYSLFRKRKIREPKEPKEPQDSNGPRKFRSRSTV